VADETEKVQTSETDEGEDVEAHKAQLPKTVIAESEGDEDDVEAHKLQPPGKNQLP
jgi:hypothetical protein